MDTPAAPTNKATSHRHNRSITDMVIQTFSWPLIGTIAYQTSLSRKLTRRLKVREKDTNDLHTAVRLSFIFEDKKIFLDSRDFSVTIGLYYCDGHENKYRLLLSSFTFPRIPLALCRLRIGWYQRTRRTIQIRASSRSITILPRTSSLPRKMPFAV